MAFIALGLATPETPVIAGESPVKGLERGLFSSAIAVNKLRNKEGTGHGRPWLSTISAVEAKVSIEIVGSVTSYLLKKMEQRSN
jgi:hypothetical protein